MSWTKEDRLLIHCLRTEIDEKTRSRIIEIEKNGLDWGYFLKEARNNGIPAIIYSKLNDNKAELLNIPSDIFEELKRDFYLNAAKNTLIFNDLRRVLESFNKTGVPVIALKGAALAEKVYNNIALRPMSDIDLLVKKEDLLCLDEQLKILGYWPSDRAVNDIDFTSTYLTTLDYRSSSKNSIPLHIHWHFVNSTIPSDSYIKNIKMEKIWQEAAKTKIAGVETLVMAPHHLLIHLSEHALRVTHSLSKLCFLCDIHEAVRFYKERLAWDKLIEDSLEFNLNRMAYLSLYFASEFLATQIPEEVLLRLRPARFSLGERVFMNYVSNNKHFAGISYFVHFSMNKGLQKKMKFIGRTFFPPPQIMAQRSYIPQSKMSFARYIHRINEVFRQFFSILK